MILRSCLFAPTRDRTNTAESELLYTIYFLSLRVSISISHSLVKNSVYPHILPGYASFAVLIGSQKFLDSCLFHSSHNPENPEDCLAFRTNSCSLKPMEQTNDIDPWKDAAPQVESNPLAVAKPLPPDLLLIVFIHGYELA